MHCFYVSYLSSVNAPVLFQENERVKAQKQASKLQEQQQEGDNQEGKGEEKAELDVNVSAICFSCYLLHYLRAIIAHFLLRPVAPEEATSLEPSRAATRAARPIW